VSSEPIPILYVAPWVDEGGPDDGTIEWFRSLARGRWSASLVTTQPSRNRHLRQIESFAEEVWDLPDLMPGEAFPEFILGFVESREIQVVHIMDSRLGFDLLPDIGCLRHPPAVVAQMHDTEPGHTNYVRYVARRYGNLVDAFSVTNEDLKRKVVEQEIPPSRVEVIGAEASEKETGSRHGDLYERLLATRPASSRWRDDKLLGSEPAEFDTDGLAAPQRLTLPRTPPPQPTVGIVVPCYRHGIFLDECIESIKAQTLAPARVVVVDDGSDDPETVEGIGRLDDDPEVEVIRQPSNRGPSAARNRALEVLDTSYVLPIDADDKLLPDALERMLARLEAAPEDVGFVYPHAQHFGNRNDYVRLPAYNLWLLLRENYCPAPALFDRRLFGEHGVRYPEEILVGHEDWDLILQLAERGVFGIHADGPTFLYRRQGFSRVNAVDYGPHEFHHAIERRHPRLYGNSDNIKTEWAPALSVVLLDEDGAWSEPDLTDLPRQSCSDFEILARTGLAEGVRAVAGEQTGPAEWLQEAIGVARGRWICVLAPAAGRALHDRSFVERLVYGFAKREERFAVALGSAPELARHSLWQLDDGERQPAEPIGIAFERRAAIPLPDIELSGANPILADFVLSLQTRVAVQWRLVPEEERPAAAPAPPESPSKRPRVLRLNLDRSMDKSEFATRDLVAHESPRLPELNPGTARRWEEASGWTPPGTRQLCRHISADGKHRIVANHRYSPPEYALEFDLGAIHVDHSPGMRRLVHANHSFELIDDQNDLDATRHGLGYVEQEPLPLLERLELRRMPDDGKKVLVAGPLDPLFEVAEPLADFGWIEAFPINPRNGLSHTGPWRALALKRYRDGDGWRHRYDTDAGDRADAVDLGSLYPYPGEGLVALQLRGDGRLVSELAGPGRATRDPRKLARWAAAEKGSRLGSAVKARLAHPKADPRGRRGVDEGGSVLGGLRREGGPNLFPLFSTTHPVTRDQLVTCSPQDAIDRGYLPDGVLGYIHVSPAKAVDLR
jgi:glycosyltransferase involved in cell wall biosynthesis